MIDSTVKQILINVKLKDLPYTKMEFIFNDLDLKWMSPVCSSPACDPGFLSINASEDLRGYDHSKDNIVQGFMWMISSPNNGCSILDFESDLSEV